MTHSLDAAPAEYPTHTNPDISTIPLDALPTPLNDHLLVSPHKPKERTDGGVILPETARGEDLDEGFVLCVTGNELSLQGATVVYRRYGGCELKIQGETFLLVPRKNILAVYPR